MSNEPCLQSDCNVVQQQENQPAQVTVPVHTWRVSSPSLSCAIDGCIAVSFFLVIMEKNLGAREGRVRAEEKLY